MAANLSFTLAAPGAEAKGLPKSKRLSAFKAGKEAKAIEVAKGVVVKQGRIIERTASTSAFDVGKLARDNKLTQKEIDEIAQGYVRGVEEDVIVAADHCFTADTPALTPMGDKPIEQFKKGDEILSRPEYSPTHLRGKATRRRSSSFPATRWSCCAGGQSITTTEKHPFYVVGKGWVLPVELSQATRSWGTTAKRPPSNHPLAGQEKVYNLRVAFDRTYFVGSRRLGFLDLGAIRFGRWNSASGKF